MNRILMEASFLWLCVWGTAADSEGAAWWWVLFFILIGLAGLGVALLLEIRREKNGMG